MKVVNQPVMKKDAMSLVTGKPVFLDDVVPDNALVVKVKRSPYAHALIEEIKIDTALKVPGLEAIYTYKDVPNIRFTMAGQTYPEPSPYDRLILDQRVRFVGDAVAIVAGENEKAVEKALRLIKVKYQELEPVLDFHTAKDNPILVHPEDNWESKCPVGADNKRNLCASEVSGHGDIEAVLKDCDVVVEHTYHRHLRKTERHQLHADRLPCPPHHRDGSWNSKIQGAGEQAQNRWRFWREADPCGGDLSGLCHLDHGKAGEDDLHPGRVSDRFHAPSRDGSYGKSGSE